MEYLYFAILFLNEDRTYKLNDMQVYITQGKVVDKETFEGTYKFENNVLLLNYEGKDYPMLLVDGKLYFDVIEKAEQQKQSQTINTNYYKISMLIVWLLFLQKVLHF